MGFNKSSWQTVTFGCFVDHFEQNELDPEKRKSARYVSVEHLESGNFMIKAWNNEEMPTFFRTFLPGHILFAKRRAYQKKVAIADFAGICSPHIWVLNAREGLMQSLLPYLMLTDKFYEFVNANSAGTMSVYLKWVHLSKYLIKLPPLKEQQQIVELFQTIDQAIEKIEAQQFQLLQLRRVLCDGLIFRQPYFGNLLSGENCTPMLLEEFIKAIEEHDKAMTDITRFVGLENIEPGEFQIKSWGNIKDGTTFTKRFRVGDVLFGKRRAYLKKVAIATFDGICSSDILVMRAKPEKILPGLLPFYVASEPFIEYAVTTSAGSLSPRTKWKDLAKFEISLPDLKTQEKILSVLQGIETIRLQLANQKSNLKKLKQQLLNEILG